MNKFSHQFYTNAAADVFGRRQLIPNLSRAKLATLSAEQLRHAYMRTGAGNAALRGGIIGGIGGGVTGLLTGDNGDNPLARFGVGALAGAGLGAGVGAGVGAYHGHTLAADPKRFIHKEQTYHGPDGEMPGKSYTKEFRTPGTFFNEHLRTIHPEGTTTSGAVNYRGDNYTNKNPSELAQMAHKYDRQTSPVAPVEPPKTVTASARNAVFEHYGLTKRAFPAHALGTGIGGGIGALAGGIAGYQSGRDGSTQDRVLGALGGGLLGGGIGAGAGYGASHAYHHLNTPAAAQAEASAAKNPEAAKTVAALATEPSPKTEAAVVQQGATPEALAQAGARGPKIIEQPKEHPVHEYRTRLQEGIDSNHFPDESKRILQNRIAELSPENPDWHGAFSRHLASDSRELQEAIDAGHLTPGGGHEGIFDKIKGGIAAHNDFLTQNGLT